MPREHFKSTCASKGLPLWLLACADRNMTIALVSANQQNTSKWLRFIKSQIEFNGVFRALFPEIRPGEKWDQNEIIVTRDQGADTETQASITALSIGSGLASQHFDYLICDDLVNEQTVAAADSSVQMEKAISLYHALEDVLQGWEDSKGFRVIGTPWGREDVIWEALKEEEAGKRLKWGIGALGKFEASEGWGEFLPDVTPEVTEGEPILPTECGWEKLNFLKGRNREQYQLQYLPVVAGTKVMMVDFSEKAIEDVEPGDEIIGFVQGGGNGHYRLGKNYVADSFYSRQRAFAYTLDNGKVLKCTEDHKWFKGWNQSGDSYGPLDYGSQVYELDWDREENADWAWLRGFIDGEGSVNHANYIGVSQSLKNLHVISHLEEVLSRLGISYKTYERQGDAHSPCRMYNLHGGQSLRLKLASQPMGKGEVLKQHAFDNSRPWTGKPKVVKIEPIGEQDVYCLQTGTGNFVADGVASANCDPFVSGHNGFDLDQIRRAAFLPDGTLECACPEHLMHKHHIRFGSTVAVSDPAYTKEKRGCESATQVGTLLPCGCRFLLEERGERLMPLEYVDMACELAKKWQTWLNAYCPEDEALQLTLKQWLEERQAIGKFPINVTLWGVKSRGRAKDSRIENAQPAVNAGFWHIMPGMEKRMGESPNTLGQLFQWPFSRKRDRADAFAYFEDAWEQFPVERDFAALIMGEGSEDQADGFAEVDDWNDDTKLVGMIQREVYGR